MAIKFSDYTFALHILKRVYKGENIMAGTQEEALFAIEQVKLDAAAEAQEVIAAINAAVAAKGAEAQAAMDALNAQIAALQAQLAAANTPADFGPVIVAANEASAAVKAIQP